MTEKNTPNESEITDRKSSGKLSRILLILSMLLVLCAASAWGWYTWAQGPVDESAQIVSFRVPKGASSSRVGKMLDEQGLIKSYAAWRIFLKLNTHSSPKAGIHKLSAAMNISQLAEALATKPLAEDISVTMVEGWRISDADRILSSKGLFSPGAYVAATSNPKNYSIRFPIEGNTLAGYLLPDTYKVPAPDGKLEIKSLVQIQLNSFYDKFYKPYEKEIKQCGRSLRDIVIMASLLEREEPDPKMRPMVAGILYKRLDSKTPLGVDATSRFALDDWNDRRKFLVKLRDPSDPYNTRLRKGLPPGPIGAPSLSSLLAALRPKKSAYWYYLHDKQQRIHFARNAAQHEANRRKYSVW